MGSVQHKGEEDDDIRIMMWLLAAVEEGKEVRPWERDQKSWYEKSPYSESALNASQQKTPLLFKGR